MNKNGVSVSKVIELFDLKVYTDSVDVKNRRVICADINRPALPLTGFFQHFESARVQVIGNVEYFYIKQLEEDARLLLPFLNSLNTEEPFTESDMFSAMECYDERYKTFPIDDIVKLTAIPIQKNQRNGRKQNVHLKIARFTLETLNEEHGRVLQGRPSKEELVRKFLEENPTATVTEVAKKIGVSRPTVYKYMGE